MKITVQPLNGKPAYEREATQAEVERMLVRPSMADIKAEARRRIEAVYPSWKQANIAREASAQYPVMLGFIDAVRDASTTLEASRPADFLDAKHWPDPATTQAKSDPRDDLLAAMAQELQTVKSALAALVKEAGA